MVRPSLWRSAGLRLAMVYALLFALSALALVLFLWWATAGLLDRQVEAAIRADAQGLFEQWQGGGLAALQTTIEDRLAENVDDDAIYLLTDREMHPLAGNLTGWPATVTAAELPYELMVSRAGISGLARVQRFDLPDGSRLLIGRDVETRTPLRGLLTSALLWSLVLLAMLGSVGGLVMQRLFRRMIASVSVTAGAIAQGDLGRRVRLSGRGDEFDGLAETINEMLDRIARLMDGVREVSNSIAHDLRTPIARARARLEDAAEHAEGATELRAAVGRAVSDLDSGRRRVRCPAADCRDRGRQPALGLRQFRPRAPCWRIWRNSTRPRRRSGNRPWCYTRRQCCRCTGIATCWGKPW